MIQFRPEQMPQFEAGVEDAFVWEQVRRLRTDFSDELSGHRVLGKDLESFVRRGMARAATFEFDGRTLTAFFLDCMAILGPTFDTDPRHAFAGDALRRTDLTPESRAEMLDQYLAFKPA